MHNRLHNLLLSYQNTFHSVVKIDIAKEKIIQLNFTETNNELTEKILQDEILFSDYIHQLLKSKNAVWGIGGYLEHRIVYSRGNIFNNENEEPRRLHIGIDIWGEVNTEVYCPLDATVHSFAFNDNYGDYGATIILQHKLNVNLFYTLYGHLSLKDIIDLEEGQFIAKGNLFAHFGNEKENGHWPPHLHFQIIENIGLYKGDYPGVCKFSEKEIYENNCPNADLILNLMKYAK